MAINSRRRTSISGRIGLGHTTVASVDRFSGVTEKEWLQTVRDLAHIRGWKVFHAFDSRRSPEGWPDLFMVRLNNTVDGITRPIPRRVAIELKTEKGKTTPAQDDWLDTLRMCGVEAYVFRPSAVDEVHKVLE